MQFFRGVENGLATALATTGGDFRIHRVLEVLMAISDAVGGGGGEMLEVAVDSRKLRSARKADELQKTANCKASIELEEASFFPTGMGTRDVGLLPEK